MRKSVFIILLLALSGTQLVYADVPRVNDVQIDVSIDGSTVTVTVIHNGPTSIHYVSEISVNIGDNEEVFELDPQTSVNFTEELNVSAPDVVEVRAFCNLHGWSQWVSVGENDSPIEEPESSGIPGFPLSAIGLALILMTQRKRLV